MDIMLLIFGLVTVSLAISTSQPHLSGARGGVYGLRSSKNGASVPLHDTKSDGTTMVLVRLHKDVTQAMVTRTFTYARQLANHPTISLAVSYDATTGDLSRLDELRGLLQQEGIESTVVIHTYTMAAVLRRYPKLLQAKAGMYNRRRPILFGFHTEPILMFWDDLPKQKRERLRWLWTLEGDVVWTGPIDRLVMTCASPDTLILVITRDNMISCQRTLKFHESTHCQ